MAQPVSLAELRDGAKDLADMEGSTFVSDSQWRGYANRWIAKLFDLLIQASPDYVSAETTVSVVAGQRLYQLPGDFRTLQAVLVQDGRRVRKLFPMRGDERGYSETPTLSATLIVEYIPTPPRLQLDSDTYDFVSGWEQFVIAGMARDALAKEESDTSVVEMIMQTEAARIQSTSSNRDRGQPKLIGYAQDDARGPWWADQANGGTLRYRLRGGQLEVFTV